MGRDGERLTRFFSGGEDDQGRSFDEILGWDDARMEMAHDYIQWIFPLPERSGANPWAPVLDPATIAAIRNSAEMQGRLRAAFLRMLAFYGFAREGDRVVEGLRFATASRNWVDAGNHNHLRLTRMLRSLRVLGLEHEAEMLWEALRALYERESTAGRRTITAETFAFWRRAATSPVED
jgi:Opioid growth factor receptor (OGFr) conserved region